VTDGADVRPEGEESTPDVLARSLEVFVDLDRARYDLDEVARLSGIDADELRSFWRALGFPEPRPGEQLFNDADVEMLSSVVEMMAEGTVEPEVARQMARVIGSSLDRIAAAQIDAQLRSAREQGVVPAVEEAEVAALMVPRVLELVWRRRLAAEARRRMVRTGSEGGTPVCVGFADLVGFTAQVQQLDTAALAEVVGRFEAIAYDVIAAEGGRVVKTIGDEVMFVNDDAAAGCRTALELARRYREDEALSDVRVGLAWGPVLERDGDVFGNTVNLASRIVSVAYPGSVVVSTELRDRMRQDRQLSFTSLRSHYLKDLGRIPLWRMRSSDDPVERSYRSARRDYAARQQVLEDLWRARREQARARAEGVVPALRFDSDGLPGRLPAVLAGTATEEEVQALMEEPTEGELDAISRAVLDADIDPDLQVDLLTDIEVAGVLRTLRRDVERKAGEADREAEAELRRIEVEATTAIEAIEREHRARVAGAIERATMASREVDEQAAARLRRVVEDAERRAEQATREARVKARQAARQRARRGRRS
jgi:adenylate cyclase